MQAREPVSQRGGLVEGSAGELPIQTWGRSSAGDGPFRDVGTLRENDEMACELRHKLALLTAVCTALVLVSGCDEDVNARSSPQAVSTPRPSHFTLGIEQDGKRIPTQSDRHTVKLQKKPFAIVFYFEEMSSMLVQASFGPQTVQAAREGKPMDQVIREDAAIVEELLNTNFLLYLNDRGFYHNWLYLGPQTHRFDAVDGFVEVPKKEGGGYLCRRTVRKLEIDGQAIPIEGCPRDRIYMVFFKADRIPGSQRRAERQRDWLILEFGR
jgi:hypothetical protein